MKFALINSRVGFPKTLIDFFYGIKMDNDISLSPTVQYFKNIYDSREDNSETLKHKIIDSELKSEINPYSKTKANQLGLEEKVLENSILRSGMLSAEKIKDLVKGINGMLEKEKSEIRFVFDATMKGRSMVSVYNVATGDLVHRMPPEVTVTISRNLNNQYKNGNMVDEAA